MINTELMRPRNFIVIGAMGIVAYMIFLYFSKKVGGQA